MEGDANLLDKTLVIYGSPMAERQHAQPPELPAASLLGHGGGVLEGSLHVKARRRHADGERAC